MIKLFGQLLVPPVLSVLALKMFFGDWWDAAGMRPRWSVWILLSAGLLLLFQFAWSAYERYQPGKPAKGKPISKKSSQAPILLKKAPAPLKHAATPRSHPVDETAMTLREEQRVLEAARRTLAGECLRVELYRDRGKLVVREVRFKIDTR